MIRARHRGKFFQNHIHIADFIVQADWLKYLACHGHYQCSLLVHGI